MGRVRGRIRPTTINEAIERARSMLGYKPELPAKAPKGTKPQTIKYRLEKYNGGKDPDAPHPAEWSYGNRTPTLDCAGFVAWCLGYSRHLYKSDEEGKGDGPPFPPWGGWVNTDSAVVEAQQYGVYFEQLTEPEPGCLVVTRSVYKKHPETGKRYRSPVGHVGLVESVGGPWTGDFRKLSVIHCSSRPKGRAAIKRTDGKIFASRGVFLRYKLAKPEPEIEEEPESNTFWLWDFFARLFRRKD